MTKKTAYPLPQSRPASALLILFCIALFSLLAILRQSPPKAVPSTAPATEFSSERALNHLRVISQKPHPIGSQEHDDVRAYILKELTALGLDPQVQETTAINQEWGVPYRVATVRNIVARLNGTGDGKAILLAGHYDTMTTGPGASDDGAAVVSLLETIRALKAGSPLRNDVILLFTDGEEMGLLGAIAFAKEHPWLREVRLAFNFEARGHSGPSMLFETSPNNSWLIGEFAKAAQYPIATSFAYEVYRRLPNNTDFTVFKEAGLPGLNFAYINGITHYHTALDTVGDIDERSIQHHGSYALALTHHFGNLDLETSQRGNAVYFDLFGSLLIRYPEAWVTLLTVTVTLVFAGVVLLGFRKKLISPVKTLLGFLAFLLCVVVGVVATILVSKIIEYLNPDYVRMPYNSALYTTSFVFLALALVSMLLLWFRKRISLQNLSIGALLVWLILLWLTTLLMPGASYLFVWPLLFGLIGAGHSFLLAEGEAASMKRAIILGLTAIAAIVIIVPAIYQISAALPLSLSGAVVFLVVLLVGLLIPQIGVMMAISKSWLPALSIACFLILIGAGAVTSGFNKNRPKLNNVFYGLDADSGKAIWASLDARPDEWTSQFFSGPVESGTIADFFPLISRTFIKSQATAIAISAPGATLIEESKKGDTRSLRIRITSVRQAPFIAVYADPNTRILRASVNGKPITLEVTDDPTWAMFYYSPAKTGIELALDVNSQQPLRIRVVDLSYGLPGALTDSLQRRPDYMIPVPVSFSDATLVSKSFTF